MREKYLNRDTIIGSLLIIFVLASLAYFIANLDWEFADWTQAYYPAAQSFLDPYVDITPGRDVYFLNPPWVTWLIFPLTIFSSRIALAIWMVITIILTVWCVKRLDGGIYQVVLVLCSPVFLRLFVHAQIDIVVLLGFTLLATSPHIYVKGIGVVLMLIKPQVLSLGIFIEWLKLNVKDKMRVLLPLVIVFLISFLLYGFWPLKLYNLLSVVSENPRDVFMVSPWPYGLPIGLVLLAIAVKQRNVYLGGLATYFFTPYLISHSLFAYTAVLFTQLPKKWSTLIFIVLWAGALLAS